MKHRALFMLLAAAIGWCTSDGARVHAATRPRPDQIRNIEQVRINCGPCDPRPGTLVSSTQLQSGRTMQIPTNIQWEDPTDAGKPTVCIVVFIRVALQPPPPPTWPPHNITQNTCYTQVGLRQLLLNPEWMQWWLAHGGAPIGPVGSTAMEKLIMDLLTHPIASTPARVVPIQ
jgi:hypothetical protein